MISAFIKTDEPHLEFSYFQLSFTNQVRGQQRDLVPVNALMISTNASYLCIPLKNYIESTYQSKGTCQPATCNHLLQTLTTDPSITIRSTTGVKLDSLYFGFYFSLLRVLSIHPPSPPIGIIDFPCWHIVTLPSNSFLYLGSYLEY